MIYLDHAATTPMPRAVIEAMWPYLTDQFANASSKHDQGQVALRALDDARAAVAKVLGCDPGEIIFTSGGTEADNLAIKGLALTSSRGKHVVTTPIEHEAVTEPIRYLERFHGTHTTFLQVDSKGLVDLDHLRDVLSDDTALCSIQYANSEIGTVQSLTEIARICADVGVPLHTDAVQAAGALDLNVKSLGVNMLSISAHKFGGPKGIGLLFRDSSIALEPLLHGGGQETGQRSGTSNVAGAVGLATALQLAEVQRPTNAREMLGKRDHFIGSVLTQLPAARLTGHPTQRLPNHASFVLNNVSGESMVVELALRGTACSSGSACAEDQDGPSPVLTAIGLSDEAAQTAVRFTLDIETSIEELDTVVSQLVAAIPT